MRGHTLLEMVLAAAMLCVLMVTIVLVYVVGASAWRKGDTQAELLQDLQASGARLAQDLAASAYDGLTVGATSLSCLTSLDKDGKVFYQAGKPLLRWARYRHWYLAAGLLKRRDFEIPGGTTTVIPLASYFGGPLDQQGELIMRNVTVFAPLLVGVRTVKVTMTAEKMRYGHRDPERVSRVFVVRVNN